MNHFFLRSEGGQRLCVHHTPPEGAETVASVIHVPAFGEEMNKSRQMVAHQSKALARIGCSVLQIDLLGCGDSSGDHADATWDAWLADVHAATRWLDKRHPGVQRWVWGHRMGALLAAEVAARQSSIYHLLLWQPLLTGKALVQQLLRLRAAAQLADSTSAKAAMASMREDIVAGRHVEVAGYKCSAVLLRALESATLAAPKPGSRVNWLEVSSRGEMDVLPASRRIVDAWRDSGVAVQAQTIEGPAFWQTTEMELAPRLLPATVEAIRQIFPVRS